jgi:hypothetical protein
MVPALAMGAVSAAQGQTWSTLTGTVRNGVGEPLAGVTVTTGSPTVPGEGRSTSTNDRGVYRIAWLFPGSYDLTATLQGWQTVKRTGLWLPIDTTLTIDVTLQAGEMRDVVTVGGAGPVVDVTTAAATTKLPTEDLENLPIGGGTAILPLVPGVTPRTAFGSALDTNQLTVDGGPMTIPNRGASAAFQVYWMQEAQIIGPGSDAEHGEFNGLVANIAARSGSNHFSGLVEQRFAPPDWVADNTGSLPENLRAQFPPLEILFRWATDAQVGGPIKRNGLFFFSGFRYARSRTVQPGTIGEVPLDVRAPAVLAKLNWVPAQSLRFDGFVERDENRSTGTLPRNALPETASDSKSRIRSWNARATWTVNPATLVELRSGSIGQLTQTIVSAERRAGPPRHVDRISGIASGNAPSFGDQDATRFQTDASLTRFVEGFGGRSHEVEVGFEVERTKQTTVSGFPGGRFFTDINGVPATAQLWAGDTIEGTGTRTVLYAQDRWRATSRLTFHPGLRLAFDRGSVPDKGPVFKTNPVSPRIGMAWDVWADHKTVVRAAYGRFHEGLYTALFDFMNTSERSPMITARVLGPDTFQETNRSAATDRRAIDEDLEHTYVDQYLVGIERELFPEFSLTGQYIRRNFDRIWAMTDTGSIYAPTQGRDPGPDGINLTADDGPLVGMFNLLNPGQSFLFLTNPDEAYRRYDGVQVIGQKRYSHNWQILAGYTWSKTRGTVNPALGANKASSFDTNSGLGATFVNPNALINANGPSGFDYTHQLTVQGAYFLPWGGVGLSGGYNYLSGGAWGRTALITLGLVGLTQGQNVRIEPRGTRRVEGAHQLDLRIEKTFTLGASRTLGIYADVFNVTNQGVPLALTVLESSNATFGQPTGWATPRYVQIAARFRF